MSKKRVKLENIDFKTFVGIFNNQGKVSAIKHVTDTYGVRYDTIVKRLRRDSEYIYDQSRDRYVLKTDKSSESQFLSLEEICSNEKVKVQQSKAIATNCDEVIYNLIKDKFFEISKYVTLENSNKKITLKIDVARNAGYDIEYV